MGREDVGSRSTISPRWIPVAPTWLGHRPEPLIHERVWACPLMLDERASSTRHAALDGEGRVIAMRDHDEYLEQVVYESTAVEVRHGDAVIVRTELEDGLPVRSSYRGGAEAYRYDGDRLVEIEESEALGIEGERYETGGTLTVEYDERGPRAIRGERGTVWERIDEPWPDLLARGARAIADGLIEGIETCGEPPGTDELDEEELAVNLWYLIGNGGGLNEIERYTIPPELDDLLLREACLKQPGDPYRAVLQEVARLLARHEWNGFVRPTEDFVVFVCEHDEDIPPKHESVRAVNPPERLAVWDARWPRGVER